MSRGMLPISIVSRDGHEEETSDSLSPWMKALVNDTVKQETAVEASRKRQSSIVNQVNNVMRNPQRYATVDDAVKDMRQRTGLEDYLQKIKQSEMNTTKKRAFQIIAFINSHSEIPEALKQFDCADDIVSFVKNTLETSHGKGSVAQLQDDIVRNFSPRCGISFKDVHDESVYRFLSDAIVAQQEKMGYTKQKNPDIGKGVGKDESNDSDDVFKLCMPQEKGL